MRARAPIPRIDEITGRATPCTTRREVDGLVYLRFAPLAAHVSHRIFVDRGHLRLSSFFDRNARGHRVPFLKEGFGALAFNVRIFPFYLAANLGVPVVAVLPNGDFETDRGVVIFEPTGVDSETYPTFIVVAVDAKHESPPLAWARALSAKAA